jgi:hypothetical protein
MDQQYLFGMHVVVGGLPFSTNDSFLCVLSIFQHMIFIRFGSCFNDVTYENGSLYCNFSIGKTQPLILYDQHN